MTPPSHLPVAPFVAPVEPLTPAPDLTEAAPAPIDLDAVDLTTLGPATDAAPMSLDSLAPMDLPDLGVTPDLAVTGFGESIGGEAPGLLDLGSMSMDAASDPSADTASGLGREGWGEYEVQGQAGLGAAPGETGFQPAAPLRPDDAGVSREPMDLPDDFAIGSSGGAAPRQGARRKADDVRRKTEEQERTRLKAEQESRKKAEEQERARLKAEEESRKKAEENERARREAEEHARLKAEADARRKAEEERARKKAEAEARKKAEAEARRKAEAEAKRKAEEEEKARRKAEAEAKKKAEEEERARKKAEADAKKKAEDERARLKAEEDARKKAEAEERARLKAAEDARRKAQEDARRKAEEDARRKAEAAEQARVKAEEEARGKAAAEARRKAEEEARAAAKRASRAVSPALEGLPLLDDDVAPRPRVPTEEVKPADAPKAKPKLRSVDDLIRLADEQDPTFEKK